MKITMMKYRRAFCLSLFCMGLTGLTLTGTGNPAQATQDPPTASRKALKQASKKAPKKALGERLFAPRDGEAMPRERAAAMAPALSSCTPALAPVITLGSPLAGALEADDCTTLIGDGTRTDIYQFSGTSGQRVTLLLNSTLPNSTTFDAYLFLLQADLSIIAQDDDGGGGTNARIPAHTGFFTLPDSGTYYVVVNCFAPDGAGAYQVSVTSGADSELQFYPLTSPVRLLDTRTGTSPHACSQPNAPITGGTSRIQPGRNFCDIPATALALVGNVTTYQPVGGGYLTFYPSDAPQPFVATINFNPNETMNNFFTVRLANSGPNAGSFGIFALSTTHVVVDVTGYYAPPGSGGLYFHPLPAPIRLLETRPGEPIGYTRPGMKLQANTETAQQGRNLTFNNVTIPTTAQALVGNATTVDPGTGDLTLFPQGITRPLVFSSHYEAGDIMNAQFTVRLGESGNFMMYTTSSTHLVIDIIGYYSADATDLNGAGLRFSPLLTPVRLLETRAGLPVPVGCYLPAAPLLAFWTPAPPRQQTAGGSCTIPDSAQSLIGNATTVYPQGGGYFTFFPGNLTEAPFVATSNYVVGQIINRHFTVGISPTLGTFKIQTSTTTHLVIDVSGYFSP